MTGPLRALGDLWSGRLGLAEAFWTWAVLIGLTVNMVFTGATLAVVATDGPALLALALHLAPVPYNLAIAVGVWRSAAAYDGERQWADLARAAVVAWAMFLTLV
jgi:hypothetical protein